jgi:hypothetical protein
MNERIKELMIEAGIYECDDFEPHPTFKKFAELLIKECLKVSYNSANMLKSTNPAYSDGIMSNNLAIREHFGVES